MSPEEASPPASVASFQTSLQKYAFTNATSPRLTRASSSTRTTPHSTTTTPAPPTPLSHKKRAPSITTSHAPPTSPFHKKRKHNPSKYDHIPNLLTDTIRPNLICLFIGLNPGIRTATTGHAYAHPSNLFWKLLHRSGCTPRLCKPSETHDLPHLYALGNTNIVSRATKDGSELSKAEMDEGVAVLEEKCRRWRPEAVCIVGKSIWESVWRVRHGRGIKKEEFSYGWQADRERMGIVKGKDGEEGWGGARVFVATTTSGLAAGMSLGEKEEVWRRLGDWLELRRGQRAIPDEGGPRVEVDLAKEKGDEEQRCGYDIEGF